MAVLTWIGGGNNEASNPDDWSPPQLPAPEDTLNMSGGTINISNFNMINSPLDSIGNTTINLSDGSSVLAVVNKGTATVNIKGTNTLELDPTSNGGAANVNLAAHSTWIGDIQVSGSVNIDGGPSAAFENSLTNGFDSFVFGGGSATVDAKVIGAGLFSVRNGTLTFLHSVSAGQTVDMLPLNPTEVGPPIVNLDDPKRFAGTIVITNPASEITLAGLAAATSYGFTNDLLSIYTGGRVIDTLSLENDAGQALTVQKQGGVVTVDFGATTNLLTMHG